MATKSTIFNKLVFAVAAFLLFGSTVLYANHTTVSTYEALKTAVESTSPVYDTILVSQRITIDEDVTWDGLHDTDKWKVIQVPEPYIQADGMQNLNPSPHGVLTIASGKKVSLKHFVIMGGGRYPFNNTKEDMNIETDTYACGAIQNQGTLNMEYCTIQRSFRGIRNHSGGQLVMKYCKLIRNVCKFGSGLLNEGNKRQGHPEDGPASTKVVMDCCSFSENYAANDGGAAENKLGAVMYFNNTIMANNIGNISAINNWNGFLYFMNSTITGNVSTTSSYDFALLIGYGMWAVNSILTDNKTIAGGRNATITEAEVKWRDATIFPNCYAHLYHCIHGANLPTNFPGSATAPAGQYVYTYDCKVATGTVDAQTVSLVGGNVFQDYLNTGIYMPTYSINKPTYPKQGYYYFEKPNTTSDFIHSALVNNANHTISAPASTTGVAANTGCETYFQYKFDEDGKLQVYMGYKDDPGDTEIKTLGTSATPDGGFTSDMKVTTYADGTTRSGDATMGSSLPTDAEFYTLILKDLQYGTCKVNGASLYGDTYAKGTELTVEVIPANDAVAHFTKWTATDKDGNPIEGLNNSTSKTLNIIMNQRIILKPNFQITNYKITYNLDGGTASGKIDNYSALTQTFTLPAQAIKKYHTFKGWSGTDIDGVTLAPVVIPTGSTGARTYTANWDAAYYPTVNPDPNDTEWHYGTFYYGEGKYQLPDGVYAYTASVEEDRMVMHKIANPGDILPGSTAVVLKANQPIASITNKLVRLPYMESGDPITITAANNLRGVDADSVVNKLKGYKSTDTYYILSGGNEDGSVTGLGFYKWRHDKTIPAHKAYIRIPQPPASAPARLRFDFSQAEGTQVATDIEDTHTQHENGTRKELRNGQLVIVRGEQVYTIHGLRIQ